MGCLNSKLWTSISFESDKNVNMLVQSRVVIRFISDKPFEAFLGTVFVKNGISRYTILRWRFVTKPVQTSFVGNVLFRLLLKRSQKASPPPFWDSQNFLHINISWIISTTAESKIVSWIELKRPFFAKQNLFLIRLCQDVGRVEMKHQLLPSEIKRNS